MPQVRIIDLDAGQVKETLREMQKVLSTAEFNRAFRAACSRMEGTLRKELARTAPLEYRTDGKIRWIQSTVKPARTTAKGGLAQCVIPLSGPRGYLGKKSANSFSATLRSRKKGVLAYVLKDEISRLPKGFSGEGKEKTLPHFMVLSGKYKGQVFVRKGPKRSDGIRPGVTIAPVEMATNRAAPETMNAMLETLAKRLNQEMLYSLGRINAAGGRAGK